MKRVSPHLSGWGKIVVRVRVRAKDQRGLIHYSSMIQERAKDELGLGSVLLKPWQNSRPRDMVKDLENIEV